VIAADTHGQWVEGSVADKTRQCCQNIKATLEAAGTELGKVVRVGVSVPLQLLKTLVDTMLREMVLPQACQDGGRGVQTTQGRGH
jgi:hypothetical protein